MLIFTRKSCNRPSRRRAFVPVCERCEERSLLSLASGIIAGTVFVDLTGSGRPVPGDIPVSNAYLELRNSKGTIVSVALTDAFGNYSFRNNPFLNTSLTSYGERINLKPALTNIEDATVPSFIPFDSNLGTLVDVRVSTTIDVRSSIAVENTGNAPADIQGFVDGSFVVSGLPGAVLSGTMSGTTPVFHATAFDGVEDFGGTSGTRFDSVTAEGTATETITDPLALAAFTAGPNRPPPTAVVSITTSVRTTGPGTLNSDVTTTGQPSVEVMYDYIPTNLLALGSYSVRLRTFGNAPLGVTGSRTLSVNLASSLSTQDNFVLRLPSTSQAAVRPAVPVFIAPLINNIKSSFWRGWALVSG